MTVARLEVLVYVGICNEQKAGGEKPLELGALLLEVERCVDVVQRLRPDRQLNYISCRNARARKPVTGGLVAANEQARCAANVGLRDLVRVPPLMCLRPPAAVWIAGCAADLERRQPGGTPYFATGTSPAVIRGVS